MGATGLCSLVLGLASCYQHVEMPQILSSQGDLDQPRLAACGQNMGPVPSSALFLQAVPLMCLCSKRDPSVLNTSQEDEHH